MQYIVSKSTIMRAALGCAILSLLFITGCGGGTDTVPSSVSDSDFALGTACTVKLYGEENRKHIEPVFELIKEIENTMSVKKEGTEASRVNEEAGEGPTEVSEETFYVVQESKYYSALGDGDFDVTIKPLVDLWGIGTDAAQVPSDEEIEKALKKVDYTKLQLNEERSTVELQEKGMGLDLGGIAKGYASDKSAELLREAGVEYGIINFGGNVLAFGEKGNESAWRIGIQSPEEGRGNYVGVVEVRNKAVVTSGKYERYFEKDGLRYHHILSTEDGRPVRNALTSVSIVTDEALKADALSTMIFVQGVEQGLATAEGLEGVEAILITKEQVIYTTSGLREQFTISDSDYARGETEALLNG